jgi:serine/threonine protein kinase
VPEPLSPPFARRGSLGKIPVPLLIRAIHDGRRSGTLHLTKGEASKRLYFREGSLVLAGSDLHEERTGQMLLRAGRIAEADLERALREAGRTGKAVGQVIVAMGVLRPEEMEVEAARRMKHIVESTLSWDSGDYFFEEREGREAGEPPSSVPVPRILLEGMRTVRDPRALRRLVDGGKGVPCRAETPPPSGGLSLTPAEEWVLAQANGVSPAEEIAAVCPLGEEEALRAVCGLLVAGFLKLQPVPAPSGSSLPPAAPPAVALPEADDLLATLEAELNGAAAPPAGRDSSASLLQPPLPRKLGRYVVEKMIGRGSMGAVLRARDPEIERPVAIKLIQTSVHLTPRELEKYKERFYREARAAGRLLHPGVVTVFDVGRSPDGIPFIVMEYVEGRTLAELLQVEPLELPEILRLARECLEALQSAHSQGIVHRDLKPANIMVTPAGHPKIMDFGVAHVLGSDMTHADEILGSPYYMAPEQFGNGTVDQRTDIFAFGVILYFILTGHLPFTGDSFAAIAHAILSKPPVPPEQVGRAVPPALGRIVLRCLDRRPERRFSDAAELNEALASIESAALRVSERDERPRPGPARRRSVLRRAAIPAIVVLALGAGLTSLYLWLSPKPPRAEKASASRSVTPESPVPPPAPAEPVESADLEAPQPMEARPTEAVLLYQATLAAQQGKLESSEKTLRELLRRNPGFAGAEDLLERVEDGLWRRKLPLVFRARHDHRIGGCTGQLRLEASGIVYRSEDHGVWRWSFDEIRSMEREDPRHLRIETDEKDLLALGRPKGYEFSLLSSSLTDEDWKRYEKLAKR